MDENYWKDAYQDTWDESSKREKRLKVYLERLTGMKCEESGLGAGSSQYISGSAARNGYQKGDADFLIQGTSIYIEVTGPLVKTVQPTAPLWFRPDKLNNANVTIQYDFDRNLVRNRFETFCYGPLSCKNYKMGPARSVPYKGMSGVKDQGWLDEICVQYRPDCDE